MPTRPIFPIKGLAMPTILVTDGIHETAVRLLRPVADVIVENNLSAEGLLALIPKVDGLMIRSASQVTEAVIAHAPQLAIIGRAGVGVDNINLPAATQRGIVVVNSPEGNTVAASEHTIGMLFALARHIPEGDASLKQGAWQRSRLVGVELFGKTLGIIGMGKIGARVAKTALSLGMKALVYDPFLTAALADELGVTPVALDQIWARADFITIHAPKTKETQHLLNAHTLGLCKPGVRIVNCARGGIIDEVALAEAIQQGHVAGAALDVFEQEPLHGDHLLLKLGNKVVLTPHLGASTEEAQVNVALDVAEQLRDFFEYGFARNAVNIPMLRKELLDPVKPYMPLAETLGRLARQIAEGAVQSVEVIAKGSLAQHKITPLTVAMLKGLLGSVREGVNYVNAGLIAEESGIDVKETATKTTEDYLNLLVVRLTTDKNTYQVAGTLIAQDIYRIVEVHGYRTQFEPTPHILFAPHQDKPGMIAKASSLLGEKGINISALQVGRRAVGEESMMIFNLDSPVDETILAQLAEIPGIKRTVYVQL
jgi:D-3-phosphoglycerate dehydrogenase / 2-oxoglutarate reductase